MFHDSTLVVVVGGCSGRVLGGVRLRAGDGLRDPMSHDRDTMWLERPMIYMLSRWILPLIAACVNLVYSDVSNVREIVNRKTQKVDRVAMVTELVQDARTALITDEIVRYAKSGRKLLVLSERRQHLNDIQEMLALRDITDSGMYIGGMSQAQLDESAERQIILGSYSMASTGLDIKDMSCLILASPLTDITQACGRILRNETSHSKLIIDIVDRVSVFLGQMRRRVALYHKQSFNVRGESNEDTMRQTLINETPRQLLIADE
tara:strand:- start:3468 stop:4256 length:789 start_codon:yes stop_codon:yes gene_type:complete